MKMENSNIKGYEEWANQVIEKIRTKMVWVSEKNRDKIPYTTDSEGNYDDRAATEKEWNLDDGLNWWTNGFWGGMMWLMYQDTKDEKYADIARISEYRMEKCFEDYYGLHHDVGFMFQPTAVADYRLTRNPRSRKIAMHAANLLAGRFNPVGKFIRAWNDLEDDTRGWAIIDCLFNISLLYWASEESGDPRFRQIAMMHADTVMKNFIRPDGSVCHIVEFDPETGEMVKSHGGQGYQEGSSWTRGQGWAVYGFMISYIHTGKQEYLDTAKKVAHYCMANLSEDGIIPVDFRQPKEPAWEDSCGACVIAGGLLELSKYVPELEKEMYLKAAVKILKAIDETRADWSEDCDAIVQNCSASYHNPQHHVTMSYADYYFMEAVYKLKNTGILLW
ncbi:MAG: glycoside hydrolase family 88 protein [Oliverpabstia sp.]